jgi:hypothetical protein
MAGHASIDSTLQYVEMTTQEALDLREKEKHDAKRPKLETGASSHEGEAPEANAGEGREADREQRR